MLRDFLVTPTLRRYELAPEVSGADVGDRGPSRHRDGGPRRRVPDPGSLLLSVSGREDGDRALALGLGRQPAVVESGRRVRGQTPDDRGLSGPYLSVGDPPRHEL